MHAGPKLKSIGALVSMAVSMSSGARFEPQKIFVFFWIFAAIVQRETVLAGLRFTAPAGVPSGAGTGVEAAG